MLPGFEAPRRPGRRRRWIIPALLTLVALGFWAVGSLSSDNLGISAFYDAVRSIAAQQAASASDFQTLVTGTVNVDRAQYLDLLSQLQASVERSAEELTLDGTSDSRPGRVSGVERIADATLSQWREGLQMFEEASLTIVDEPDNPVAVSDLSEALGMIAAGDTLYEILADEVEALRVELELPDAELPTVAYLPEGAGTPAFLDALVGRLRAASELEGVRGVVVANILTVPEATGGDEGGIARLPHTDTLEVNVVVANEGNVREEEIVVLMTVDDATGNRIDSQQLTIDALDGGAETTVTFAGVPVVGGQFYLIDVGMIAANTGSPIEREVFIAEAAPVETQG